MALFEVIFQRVWQRHSSARQFTLLRMSHFVVMWASKALLNGTAIMLLPMELMLFLYSDCISGQPQAE